MSVLVPCLCTVLCFFPLRTGFAAFASNPAVLRFWCLYRGAYSVLLKSLGLSEAVGPCRGSELASSSLLVASVLGVWLPEVLPPPSPPPALHGPEASEAARRVAVSRTWKWPELGVRSGSVTLADL